MFEATHEEREVASNHCNELSNRTQKGSPLPATAVIRKTQLPNIASGAFSRESRVQARVISLSTKDGERLAALIYVEVVKAFVLSEGTLERPRGRFDVHGL